MTILNILQFPDPKLRIKAQPIDNLDEKLQAKIDDMFETMYDAKGIGLAGTQVDFHKRLLVTDVSNDKDEPYVLINPVILSTDGIVDSNEGCLSVPGFQDDVQRAKNIIVKFLMISLVRLKAKKQIIRKHLITVTNLFINQMKH